MSGQPANVHAGLVRVGAAGILIRGPARSGKSSLAVSLLRAAARESIEAALVADDRVVLERRDRQLVGRAPETIAGLIELSGIGILRVPTLAETPVTLVADLGETIERLPEQVTTEIGGLALPRLVLPMRQAPFAADLLLTVLAAGPLSILGR